MPLTRSGSNSRGSDEDGVSDELNTTIQEQNVNQQQHPTPLEQQISTIVRQMADLQNAVTRLSNAPNNVAADMRLGRGNSSGGNETRENDSVSETLANLNRVLSSSSGQGAVKKLYDLPEFDGRPEDWPMFRESFLMTTQEYGYNERQNMIRLQKAIKGKAREIVECLLIHSNNVPRVIDVLGERFGRPEQLVKSQIARIRSCAPIPENRLDMMVPFATKVQNLAAFLEGAGCEHHLANPTLMEELLFKLPTSRRLEWARYAINITPRATISHFSEWLQELARVVNITCLNSMQETRPIHRHNEGRSKFFHVGTNGNQANSCDLCTETHHIRDCNRFKAMDIESRWSVVRQKRLCFNCLARGHRSNRCGKEHKCSTRNCTKKVHELLHPVEQRSVNEIQRQDISRQPVFTNAVAQQENVSILFKILPVKLYANGRETMCYAFIDEGSAVTLMNRRLANQLALKGNKEKLTLQWFGNNSVTQMVLNSNIQISGLDTNSRRFCMKNVKIIEDLQLPKQTLNMSQLQWKHRFSKHLPIANYDAAIPELLIGLDNAHLGVAKRVVADGRCGPTVVLTKLGWVLYGPTCNAQSSSENPYSLFVRTSGESKLEELVENFIVNDNMEASGGTFAHVESAADERANILLNTTTIRKGQRFETGLLWKSDDVVLPDSRGMAEKRFLTLERKFLNDASLREQYKRIIAEYIQKGYVRRLNGAEAQQRGEKTWYLPHFGVRNMNKPDKLRVVFDAAAETNGVSLNSVLLSGPDLGQSLTMVLMKFRQRAVGVCADVVEMFHQVRVRREDQEAQRFLWRSDPEAPMEDYVMSVMTFGATCSPCSAQFVKNKNAREFDTIFPEATTAIIQNHYVDDYVHCFSTDQDAVRVTKEVVWIHKQAGFELRRFVSNHKKVSGVFNKEDTVMTLVSLDKSAEGQFQRVLGMVWDTAKDELKFALSFNKINNELITGAKKPTKREALSITMSIFDPFGLAAEYSIVAKLILQKVWKDKVEWDHDIPDEAFDMWRKWLVMLKDIETLRMPRCYDENFFESTVELHVFADASESAYGAVAYWRVNDGTGTIRLAFVAGKAKCAPLKLTTVPRLELQAAVLATRLRATILENHDLKPVRTIMWSDSKTVLSWVTSDHRRYKPYVAHRINEILAGSEVEDWRWVPSMDNPADFATRLRSGKRKSFWAIGPNFLLRDESEWPVVETQARTNEELRTKFLFHFNYGDDILKRFSCFTRMKRVIAWVLRFYNNTRMRHQIQREHGYLTVAELEASEVMICRVVQGNAYPEEYGTLVAGKQLQRNSSLWKLTPYIDESGVMRVKGRIDVADVIPFQSRRPIILPKNHHVTNIIVSHHHSKARHQNEETIIAEIRRKFWVPHVRVAVRRAAKDCPVCKKNRAKPQPPIMGQLPEDRLTPFVRPFSYVGIDYMGPFLVAIGRRREKRWIALFTCLTTRAIHLEIAKDLSTDTCLLCIRNFMCRRGTPIRIRSDNATNFIGADKELQRQRSDFESGKIADALANEKIEWVFNCPLNPHVGGCWERLVRSVKRAMGHALYDESLSEHSLYSLLCEAENLVNSRPLTHIPLETPTDEPLTPNHFLIGTANTEQTPHPREEEHQASRKQWRKVQQAQHRFWKRWIREYLPDLCRRTKWYQSVEPLKEGDLVLLCDSNVHRSKWPLGRIIRVFPGKDNQVRAAEVQTKVGVFKRPACILAKLDVGESDQIHGGRDVIEYC